jgi:succinate-semialdehyde dehydrogenase / glutarate-semialdehyde dehydrogenase
MSITDAIPAMLGGNPVVLRPDNCSALTALAALALLDEAGLPSTGQDDQIGLRGCP